MWRVGGREGEVVGGKRGRDQILGLFIKYNPQQILLSKSGNNNIHNFYQFFFFSVKYFSKNIQFFFLQKKIRLIVFNNFQNLFPFVAVVLQISSLGHLSWYTRLLILWKPHRRPHHPTRSWAQQSCSWLFIFLHTRALARCGLYIGWPLAIVWACPNLFFL